MKVAYIHDTKKQLTGAHHINNLIISQLRKTGVEVTSYYPALDMPQTDARFRGMRNILFFHSLLEQKKEILKADIIQGTTYTPISFLGYGIPVVCHFGSTNWGFLKSTPRTHRLDTQSRRIISRLRQDGVIGELDYPTHQPLRDIAEVEIYTALLADLVIAASVKVKDELISYGLTEHKIKVVHNGIDDYWLDRPLAPMNDMHLVFLGRVGNDAFYFKLKGVDRLISIYEAFPKLPKVTIAATAKEKFGFWLEENIKNHISLINEPKEDICDILNRFRGSIALITSRYEGFSLSLIEAMSRGLIPITYPVGVAPEIIRQGENGYMIKNTEQAKKYIRQLANDPLLRERLSRNAARTARKFGGNAMGEKLNELYTEMLTSVEGKDTAQVLASEDVYASTKAKQKIQQASEVAAHTRNQEIRKQKLK